MHNCMSNSSSLTKETAQSETTAREETRQQSQLVNALVDSRMETNNNQNLPADAIRAISMIGNSSEPEYQDKHFPTPYSRADSVALARERWIREGHADKLHEPRPRRASVHHPTGLHAFKQIVIQQLRRASYSETGSAPQHHWWHKHAGHTETQPRRCSAEMIPPVTSPEPEGKKSLSLLLQRFKAKVSHSPATSVPASPSKSSMMPHVDMGGFEEAVPVRSSKSASATSNYANHGPGTTSACGIVPAFLHPSTCGSLNTESMRLEHDPKPMSASNSVMPQTSPCSLPGAVDP